jgi:hypothetical protein
MYRGTMLVLDLLPQYIFQNHVQVIPEIMCISYTTLPYAPSHPSTTQPLPH